MIISIILSLYLFGNCFNRTIPESTSSSRPEYIPPERRLPPWIRAELDSWLRNAEVDQFYQPPLNTKYCFHVNPSIKGNGFRRFPSGRAIYR